MLESKTNFACLMDLIGVKSVEICRATGADKTQVSRWRSGKRRMIPGRHWVMEIADCLLSADEALDRPVIPEVLRAYYPSENFNTIQQRRDALARWLASSGQKQTKYVKERDGLLGMIHSKMRALEQPAPEPPLPEQPASFAEGTVVYGVKGVQASTLQAVEIVLNMAEPQDILFVCPEGLDMYTRDTNFAPKLMDALMRLFAAGHRMSVVLRTDYRMSDVSTFSGKWLVAHLLGYIRSYYFDEFYKTYADKMMAVVGDHIAYKVWDLGGGVFTRFHFDRPTVSKIRAECDIYMARAKQRFHYGFFGHPHGCLHGVEPLPDRDHYQFARMPHLCLTGHDAFKESFQLSDDEMELVAREFPPFLFYPEVLDVGTHARHVFCEDDIEDALLKSRHVSQELSAITGRRVNMTTQRLAEQLLRIRNLLVECPNYEVCFVPDSVFKKLTMQITVWGDRAAIGWIAGGESAACHDYTNCNALTGFCGMVWDQLPVAFRLRRVVLRKLNTWLKKAKKYGLNV